eukprot:scaffold1221_cov107-Isochrysis_galbana.AAC.2
MKPSGQRPPFPHRAYQPRCWAIIVSVNSSGSCPHKHNDACCVALALATLYLDPNQCSFAVCRSPPPAPVCPCCMLTSASDGGARAARIA